MINVRGIAGLKCQPRVVYSGMFLFFSLLIVLSHFGWFSSNLRVFAKNADTQSLIKVFSSSKAAIQKGFLEQETLSLASLPFYEAYSLLVARLTTAKKGSLPGTINYLAAAALLAINAEQQEQKEAALKVFFRYYPDVFDDPAVFSRVIVLSGALPELEKSSPLRQEIRQAAWKLAGAAIERNVTSGAKSLPELAELAALFPELDAMVRNSLNPPPVPDHMPSISDFSPITESENAI